MNNSIPMVSVIVPCRNEEKFIGKCLDSVIAQDYPHENLEILVIDGMSEDRTREIIEEYTQEYSFIRLLDNSEKITPTAFNIGIKNSKGQIIIIMSAHAIYEIGYISKCIKYSKEYNADNVGGILKTIPAGNTIVAKAIALVLAHRFGAGNSYFRIGSKEPKLVDTVLGGCYKRKVFEKIGFFNEKLIRNQDLEFNLRLKKAGGKIFLVPEILSYYYPSSSLKTFWKHNFMDGFSITYPLKYGIKAFSWRHLVPFVFVLSLISLGILSPFFLLFRQSLLFIICLYFLGNLYFVSEISIRNKNFKYFIVMPLIFATRHIGYGLGSIWGTIKLLVFRK